MPRVVVFVSLLVCLGCSSAPPEQGEGAGGGPSTSARATSTSTSSGRPSSSTGSGGDGGDGAGGGAGGEGGAGCLSGGVAMFDGICDGSGARFVTRVVEACVGPGGGFGLASFPDVVFGLPKGAGDGSGSLDVLGLGEGGAITLAFDGNAIVDGPGPDFIVFENAFKIGGGDSVYANPARVEVSDDGVTWTAFPCDATAAPWGSCAGWHPVYANPDDAIDPLDPATAGGDAFDLADVGVARARFVRITDRADLPGDFDLDAIAIVNAACP